MAKNEKRLTSRRSDRGRPLKTALVVGAFIGVSQLGACAQVPDALNPAEWYRGTVDFFSGDDKPKASQNGGLAADRGKAPPGAEKDFPKLATVDQQARARDTVKGGLSADPDRPKYAPSIPLQSQAPAAPPPAQAQAPATTPPSAPAATMPPPAAAPTTPVMPAPPMTAQPAPSPPAVASRPMTATPDQKAAEARLTQRLAEIRARAAEAPALPADAQLPGTAGSADTIVVSSAGIQTPGFKPTEAPPTVTVPPAAPGEGARVDTRGALPVPANAVRVATILFDNGSAKLRSRDRRILGAVSSLQRQNGGTVRIVGHASARTRNLAPIRHKMANFQISVDRADQVAAELVRLGVAKEDILIAAVSDAEPLYYEIMPSGEAGNRRAEIYLGN